MAVTLKNMVLWVLTQCCFKRELTAWFSGFLPDLPFDPEDGGIFSFEASGCLRNTRYYSLEIRTFDSEECLILKSTCLQLQQFRTFGDVCFTDASNRKWFWLRETEFHARNPYYKRINVCPNAMFTEVFWILHIFSDVRPLSMVDKCQRFTGICFHIQYRKLTLNMKAAASSEMLVSV